MPPGMPGALDCVTIMSSTRISRTAVSAADWIACRLTRAGSITPASNMSTTSPEKTFRPMCLPPFACAVRRSTSLSSGLKPEFSARVSGTDSNAFANASIASWTRPPTEAAYSRRRSESSISTAIALYVQDHDGYAAVNALLSMPLFFTSSALMPYDVMPPWLAMIARYNPVSWAIDLIRSFAAPPVLWTSLLALVMLALAMGAVSSLLFRRVTV